VDGSVAIAQGVGLGLSGGTGELGVGAAPVLTGLFGLVVQGIGRGRFMEGEATGLDLLAAIEFHEVLAGVLPDDVALKVAAAFLVQGFDIGDRAEDKNGFALQGPFQAPGVSAVSGVFGGSAVNITFAWLDNDGGAGFAHRETLVVSDDTFHGLRYAGELLCYHGETRVESKPVFGTMESHEAEQETAGPGGRTDAGMAQSSSLEL